LFFLCIEIQNGVAISFLNIPMVYFYICQIIYFVGLKYNINEEIYILKKNKSYRKNNIIFRIIQTFIHTFNQWYTHTILGLHVYIRPIGNFQDTELLNNQLLTSLRLSLPPSVNIHNMVHIYRWVFITFHFFLNLECYK